jgi:cysteine dioxygenase
MEISDSEVNKTERYTDPKTIVPPRDLDELVQELHKVFASDHVNVEYVTRLMASYKSNPKDWKKYAIFDLHR